MNAYIDIDFYKLFEECTRSTPVLSAVRPIGDTSIEAFEAAGGARAVMKQLAPLLDLEALTVTGQSVGANLRDATVGDPEIIRPLDRPLSDKSGIVIVRGNLAPARGPQGPLRLCLFQVRKPRRL